MHESQLKSAIPMVDIYDDVFGLKVLYHDYWELIIN